MKKFLKVLMGAAAMFGTSAAIEAPAFAAAGAKEFGKPARINWAANGGIRDWHAEDDRSLYLRDRTGRWYYATLRAPCPSLPFQHRVAFETGPLGEFDNWGVIRTPLLRCHVDTLVTSPAPAAKGGPKLVR